MVGVHFSLTEKMVINPVLQLRASPLITPDASLTNSGKVRHFFQAEVLTRIMAIATSVFALIDSMAHLMTGVVKSAHFGARKLGFKRLSPAPSGAEISHHFKQTGKFLMATAFGSIAAVFVPKILKKCRVAPFLPHSSEWKSASEKVQQLWQEVGKENEFKRIWKQASLSDRRIFVHLLDQAGGSTQAWVINTIYRKVCDHSGLTAWPKQNKKAYYHATTKHGLKGILESGKVEVRHEKTYRGAFVSTRPELDFGKYVLVFKRNIERLSDLSHGFTIGSGPEPAYWAGFSQDIPVNENTLDKVLVCNATGDEVASLQKKIERWTDRKIKVKFYKDPSVDPRVPKEWANSDPQAAAIQNTMKIRYQAALQKKQSVPPALQKKQSVPQRAQQRIPAAPLVAV